MIQSASIVGAGIAGLATAVALERRGVSVQVYEQAPELRNFGGALMLWSNAMRALRALGLENEVMEAGTPLEAMQFRDWSGKLLWTMPVKEASGRNGAASVVIPRAALIDVLSRALVHPIRFGARYSEFVEKPDYVEILFENGDRVTDDLLVGADGVRSRVRERLEPRRNARSSGQIVWLGRSFVHDPLLVTGVPVGTLGRGPKFWAAPIRDGEVWWHAIVRESTGARTLDDVAALFAPCYEPIPTLMQAADETHVRRAEIWDRPNALRWYSSRVTLVGDAAHCTRPDLGQGACQALESAVALSTALVQFDDVQTALSSYRERRFARAAQTAVLAQVTSLCSGFEHPVLQTVRDLGIRTSFPLFALPALDWMLGGDARPP